MSLKSTIRKIIPENILLQYHKGKAILASKKFGNPTKDIFVIGITGTKGKSTTANFVWSVLQAGGIKTGLIGTANIRIGNKEEMNTYHMTMPSPMVMQKIFSQMKNANCKALVMEVTSEGIKQYRHLGIDFDLGVFTNLSPEHLPSHNNSFEDYKNIKLKYFKSFINTGKTIVVNGDDEHSDDFLDVEGVEKITTSLGEKITSITEDFTTFVEDGFEYKIFVGGTKNVENALLAVAIGKKMGLTAEQIQAGFESLKTIPGRMEKIQTQSSQNFSVFVDYAHEEKSMDFLMTTGQKMTEKKGRVIVLLGAEGGGRDPAKRPKMGRIVAQKADIVVVSNVDPYDDDPIEICEDIAVAAENAGKKRGENLFVIEDRRSGIRKCLEIAQKDDVIFITGKGSEQSMILGKKTINWDDREVVKEELEKV